jgi:energy-coupling factor transporter transmembrane protein EcfT
VIRRHRREVYPLAGLLTGLMLTTSCLVLPASTPLERSLFAVPPLVTLLAYLPLPRVAVKVLAAVVVVYAPLMIFLPVGAVLRGASSALVAATSIGIMGYLALHDAVNELPLPQLLKLLVLQILHQTSVLMRETSKIRQAMDVRGALSRGRTGWEFLHALPRVWIPRVVFKAERIAHALEVRGYGVPVPSLHNRSWGGDSTLFLLVGLIPLLLAIAVRWVL